jgi:hypothetical protein
MKSRNKNPFLSIPFISIPPEGIEILRQLIDVV